MAQIRCIKATIANEPQWEKLHTEKSKQTTIPKGNCVFVYFGKQKKKKSFKESKVSFQSTVAT